MKTSEELKKIVKEKYGDIAKNATGCCGSELEYTVMSDEYKGRQGYNEEADLSLGCGIPTDLANIKKGDSVLDLGSGAGNDCFVARALVGEEGKVVGLDFTDEMLQKANKNVGKLGYSNVEFVKGDIENIPLNNESFDVVISNCVLNLVPDKTKAFSEIRRVLKDGAHFCVSDIVLEGQLPEKLMEAAALYAGCVSGALQKEDYLNIIKTAGFKNIDIKKSKTIDLPDELLLKYLSNQELESYRKAGIGIISITVYAVK